MNSPEHVSKENFENRVQGFLKNEYNIDNLKKEIRCKKCNSKIKQVTCAVSLHDSTFTGCVGYGDVQSVSVPFCPKCEDVPRSSGCFHGKI